MSGIVSPLATLLSLPIAMLAGVAAAQLRPQPQTGSILPALPVAVDPARAAAVEHRFGQCLYRANPRAATTLLMHSDPEYTDLAAAGIRDINGTFDMEHCLGNETRLDEVALGMRVRPATIRMLLEEQAYLAATPKAPTLAEGAVEFLPRSFVADASHLPRAKAVAAFADCVVFNDVGHADALLRTVPGGVAEGTAAQALVPALGKCLRQGQQMSLNVRAIRAMMADGLWYRFARPVSAQ